MTSSACTLSAPIVNLLVLPVCSLSCVTFGWIVVTVIWDDIRDRLAPPKSSRRIGSERAREPLEVGRAEAGIAQDAA
jgi:hypothetical protein